MDGRTGSQRWTSLSYLKSWWGRGGSAGGTLFQYPLSHPLSSSPLPPPPSLQPQYSSHQKWGEGEGEKPAGRWKESGNAIPSGIPQR